jgi:hypothetical protein
MWQAVPEDVWRAVQAGGEWPDEAPGVGHNRPPLPIEQEREDTLEKARAWLDDPRNSEVATQVQADAAAHYRHLLRGYYKDIEEEERAKKKPYQDFIETIRQQYRRLREPFAMVGTTLNARLTPYLIEQDKAKEEERKRVAAENLAKREAGKRPSALPDNTNAGPRGHKVSLRTHRSARIVNFFVALEAAADAPEIQEALQTVANRRARECKEGMSPEQVAATLLPGTELVEERRAA